MIEYLKKIRSKLVSLFKQGLSPKQLALSISISILISIFPIFGITTIVLTCIALPLKLNLPIAIALSYIVEPLKLLLMIPFINIGASLLGTEHALITFEAIKTSYQTDFFKTLSFLSYELLCGAIGWAITAIPFLIVFYLFLEMVLKFSSKQISQMKLTTTNNDTNN
jgi:uncharacterized protein (DUF2062 family)